MVRYWVLTPQITVGNLTAVDGGTTATYFYDALNHRVRETIGSSDTDYGFNTDGQRVTSWSATSASPTLIAAYAYWNGRPLVTYNSSNNVFYSHQDLLGTKRLTTNASGTPIGTFASLPFGDGYTPTGTDPDPSHFALLDHDAESNTDHAQARQYNSTPGTWMSPDPYDGSYDQTNPQSFNRYVYAGNNPLMYIDPDGLDPCAFFGGAPISSLDGCDAKADIYGAAFGQPPPNPTQLGLDAIAEYESYSSRAIGRDEALYVEALEAPSKPTVCPAVPFNITGVGPNQAPGTTAITQTPRSQIPIGGVAIKLDNFRSGSLAGTNWRPVIEGITLTAAWGPEQAPAGIPTQGPYSPVDTIGNHDDVVAGAPNQIDVYGYTSQSQAFASTRNNVMVTATIPANNIGVRCPVAY